MTLSALTPNLSGFQRAVNSKVDEIAVFTEASETFNQKNIRCSIAESFERIAAVLDAARTTKLRVRGYVSCVISCPYEGPITPKKVADISIRLFKLGCHEIPLGDTIGTGTPSHAEARLNACQDQIPLNRLAGHFHNTWGQAHR